jgi:Protein of unknown function (DUF3014)
MDGPTPPKAPRDFEPRTMIAPPGGAISRGAVIAAAAVIVLALGGAWYWWQQRNVVEPPPAVAAATPTPVTPAPAPAPAPAASPPAIQHPIEPEAPASAVATAAPLTLDTADAVMRKALIDLLSSKPVSSWLRTDDFVRRAVATVDGLGSSHSAPRLWPVNPTAGRFAVQRDGDTETIGNDNAARYAPFVGFVESVDVTRAAALYRRHYPLFQDAYKELGYPQGYFNDRLVAVLDQMLATPEPSGPLAVRLVEVKGEVASTQPWLRYEFTDPQLEALPAGSKLLLRMGPDNARRVKAKLRALRNVVSKQPPATN